MDTTFNLRSTENDRLFASRALPKGPLDDAAVVSSAAAPAQSISRKRRWTGRVVSGLATAFLLFDAIPKILEMSWVMKATAQMGFPTNAIQPIGIVLLGCTILYAIPRTAVLGAILLTGYLGGAIEANVHLGAPLFSHVLFPIYVAVFVWGGLALRDSRVWRVFDRVG